MGGFREVKLVENPCIYIILYKVIVFFVRLIQQTVEIKLLGVVECTPWKVFLRLIYFYSKTQNVGLDMALSFHHYPLK